MELRTMTTYYIQRTTVEIIAVEGADPEAALESAIDAGNWQSSIDTEIDYIVLDESGKQV